MIHSTRHPPTAHTCVDRARAQMRDPLVPINAAEVKQDPASEKQALCISIATLILSIPALIGA